HALDGALHFGERREPVRAGVADRAGEVVAQLPEPGAGAGVGEVVEVTESVVVVHVAARLEAHRLPAPDALVDAAAAAETEDVVVLPAGIAPSDVGVVH